MRRFTTLAVLAAGLLLVAADSVAARPGAAVAKPTGPVNVQLLTVSDWHGQLTPINTPAVGGAAVLKAHFDANRAANPNTLTFMAGDSFGATPPISSFFEDEPAVRA